MITVCQQRYLVDHEAALQPNKKRIITLLNYYNYYMHVVKLDHIPDDKLVPSSWMVLHCWDNLCEYILMRSFSSCGSKLWASMAPTSIMFLQQKQANEINDNSYHRTNGCSTKCSTYVAKSCTIRFNAFISFFCGTAFWCSCDASPLRVITVGLLLTGFGNKCVRSFGSFLCKWLNS